jgi:hypothetical protein
MALQVLLDLKAHRVRRASDCRDLRVTEESPEKQVGYI